MFTSCSVVCLQTNESTYGYHKNRFITATHAVWFNRNCSIQTRNLKRQLSNLEALAEDWGGDTCAIAFAWPMELNQISQAQIHTREQIDDARDPTDRIATQSWEE